MAAKIIAIANQKGGTGKTTIAMQLAGSFHYRHSLRVLVADADKQGSAMRWSTGASDERPFPATIAGVGHADGKVHREIRKYVDDYEVIIIDCPPAVESPVPESAFLVADLALLPLRPSAIDLYATVPMRALIERARAINEALQARIVINQIQRGTLVAREVLEVVPQLDIEPAKTQIPFLNAYARSALLGTTVHALGVKANAAIEAIDNLALEVLELLGNRHAVQEARYA